MNAALGRFGNVEIDACETVDLDIDEAGRDPEVVVIGATGGHLANHFIEFDRHEIARRGISSRTNHEVLVLFTTRPQGSNMDSV